MFAKIKIQNTESPKGFTLLELLIVIAIISILFVGVVITLNPAETLKKARDTQRITDLSTLKTAISLYVNETTSPSMGTAGDIYVSLNTTGGTDPEDYSACTPADASFDDFIQVETEALITKNDATGWIPINFSTMSIGSPLATLPKDPTNTGSDVPVNADLVYRYVVDANFYFEINCAFESTYYKTTTNLDANDGGTSDDLFEVGTKLDILDSAAASGC